MAKRPIGMNIKPYCTCILTGTWKQQDGWTQDYATGLWVHPRCRKVSQMNYERIVAGKETIEENRDMNWFRGEEDPYQLELRLNMRQIVLEELDWGDDLD